MSSRFASTGVVQTFAAFSSDASSNRRSRRRPSPTGRSSQTRRTSAKSPGRPRRIASSPRRSPPRRLLAHGENTTPRHYRTQMDTPFSFFIKDYLVYALDHPDSELTEHLVYRLGSVDVTEEYWEERIKLFTSGQAKLISGFCSSLKEMLPETEGVLKEHLERAIGIWSKAAAD